MKEQAAIIGVALQREPCGRDLRCPLTDNQQEIKAHKCSLQETERCQQVSLKAPELSLREQLSPGQNLNFGFTRGHAKPSEDFWIIAVVR